MIYVKVKTYQTTVRTGKIKVTVVTKLMISCTTDGHVEISFVRTWYILASALQFALLKDTENYEKNNK